MNQSTPIEDERFAVASSEPAAGDGSTDEVRRLQLQVQTLVAQLLEAQRLEDLGLLTAGIAHDFNNLLTAVLGYTELARAALPPDSLPAIHCDHAAKGLRRAAELARQLMAYAGRAKLKVRPVNLSQTITELEGLLDAWVGGHGSLIRVLDPHLPEIQADPVQMSQLVMNLVGNAAESIQGSRGAITIRTQFTECDSASFRGCHPSEQLPQGNYVVLQVSDNGGGIPDHLMSHLFDPFFSTKTAERGERGLGLTIVHGIVVRHHGTIRIESVPHEGTTFTVYLPTFGNPDPIGTSSP